MQIRVLVTRFLRLNNTVTLTSQSMLFPKTEASLTQSHPHTFGEYHFPSQLQSAAILFARSICSVVTTFLAGNLATQMMIYHSLRFKLIRSITQLQMLLNIDLNEQSHASLLR